ncbi:MAG: ankyrin repeat domain-containing protein [Candidatus Promineifilaceae bacterium]
MSELSHEKAKRLIHKDQLSSSEQLALRSHLRTCPDCRRHTGLDGLLRHYLVPDKSSTRPSPQFTAVFMESAARRSRRSHIMKPVYAVGGAIALALVVLAGWFIVRANPQAATLEILPVKTVLATAPEPIVTPSPVAQVAHLDRKLITAVASKEPDVVQSLLSAGANPNIFENDGDPLLKTAVARSGQQGIGIVRLLVESGADPNLQDRRGNTALHQAARIGNMEAVTLLIEHGADVNLPNNGGVTALDIAVDEETVAMLRDAGATTDSANDTAALEKELIANIQAGNAAAVEELLNGGVDPDFVDQWGNNAPLPLAAKEGRLEIVQLLVEAGADVNNSTMNGRTPFGSALTAAPALLYAAAWDHLDIVEFLLANGADPNAVEEGDGGTPLQIAAWFNYPEIVTILLENGAEVDIRRTDEDGMTPLHGAASTGAKEVVALLIEAGADVNLQDFRFGNTALLYAVVYALEGDTQVEMTRMLLDAGADPNLASKRGKTPIMTAVQNNNIRGLNEIITMLLEAGADPNRQDYIGDSPLHYAARAGEDEVVALLIEHGAAVDSLNNAGQTPLDVATNDEIVEMLRDAGAE